MWRCGLLILLLAAGSLYAQHIADSEYGFTAYVPAGFKRMPPDRPKISKATIHAFYLGDFNGVQPVILIGFEDLGGSIGRERLEASDLPPTIRSRTSLETSQWKEFEVDVLVSHRNANGVEVITFSAQVPIKPKAIQVHVAGPKQREAELRQHLKFVLANMDGETNWLTDSERIERIGRGLAQLVGSIFAVAAIMILIVRRVRRNRRYRDPEKPLPLTGRPQQYHGRPRNPRARPPRPPGS